MLFTLPARHPALKSAFKRSVLTLLGASAGACALAGPAQAQSSASTPAQIAAPASAPTLPPVTFDFEDVPPNAFTARPVPDGYGGGVWTGWTLRRTSDFTTSVPFVINGTTMALSGGTAPRIDFATPTSFYGAYIGNPAQLNVIGQVVSTGLVTVDFYLGGALVFSNPGVDHGGRFVASSYTLPVDSVVFGHTGGRTITLDDVAIGSPVPEAGTWAMWAAGLAAVVGLQRRRQR